MLILSSQWNKVGSWLTVAAIKRQINFSAEDRPGPLASVSDLLSRTPLKHQASPCPPFQLQIIYFNLLLVISLALLFFNVLNSISGASAQTAYALFVTES